MVYSPFINSTFADALLCARLCLGTALKELTFSRESQVWKLTIIIWSDKGTKVCPRVIGSAEGRVLTQRPREAFLEEVVLSYLGRHKI